MKTQIYAETSIAQHLREFINKEKIDLDVVTDKQYEIKVAQCEERKESNLDTIYSGGWIACETARSIAKKINIPLSQMGKLLNHLNVKIRSCSLGCFK